METISNSVKKTRKVIIVEECMKTGGIGASLSATINESLFDDLDHQVRRLRGHRCLRAKPLKPKALNPKDSISSTRARIMTAHLCRKCSILWCCWQQQTCCLRLTTARSIEYPHAIPICPCLASPHQLQLNNPAGGEIRLVSARVLDPAKNLPLPGFGIAALSMQQ